MTRKEFEVLEAEYLERIRFILWNKDQIDQLRDSLRMLTRFSTRRATKAWSTHAIEEGIKELERREADERDLLEEAYEIALDIVNTGCTQA